MNISRRMELNFKNVLLSFSLVDRASTYPTLRNDFGCARVVIVQYKRAYQLRHIWMSPSESLNAVPEDDSASYMAAPFTGSPKDEAAISER